MIALPFFLLGHIAYCAVFLFDFSARSKLYSNFSPSFIRSNFIDKKTIYFCYIFIHFIITYALVYPVFTSASFLFFPVSLYFLIIFFLALVSLFPSYNYPFFLAAVFLYCQSDALLALHLFYSPLGLWSVLTWPLYYFAQLFFVFGFILETKKIEWESGQKFCGQVEQFAKSRFTLSNKKKVV